jgi:hypothetical protein
LQAPVASDAAADVSQPPPRGPLAMLASGLLGFSTSEHREQGWKAD